MLNSTKGAPPDVGRGEMEMGANQLTSAPLAATGGLI